MVGSLEENFHWLESLRRQDKSAFTQLVRKYHANVLRLAQSIVGVDSAQDVAQDVWLSVYRSLSGFEGRASLKTWILRIASHRAIDYLRANNKELDAGDWNEDLPGRFDEDGNWLNPPMPWTADTPEALLLSDELQRVIESTIQALPPLQGAVLRLHEIEDQSVDDICKILDISASNYYVLLHRAKTRLWNAIEAYQRFGHHD
ncbi:hypothetical protein BI364_08325 [Acidihalobacter yilgarnensis]|uniref:RNA polymerase sigma factor n=1 Tax=Acidihalobacter yilgarnensis TaxID=2819280 RepID=A0A1D8IND0_9GAMM|nr:sigma-70 family RNA polymerase sigma factor [Acidihalobacter yilgarnensis]AOU97969.1 hypothetical protein BI364_08325 [Acidihalobacter yilgarnensis]